MSDTTPASGNPIGAILSGKHLTVSGLLSIVVSLTSAAGVVRYSTGDHSDRIDHLEQSMTEATRERGLLNARVSVTEANLTSVGRELTQIDVKLDRLTDLLLRRERTNTP